MSSTEPPSKKTKTESETEKKNKLSNYDNLKIVVDEINTCQVEIEKLNEKASEEILQIEQKYNKIRKPFFRQRNELFKKLPKFWGNALCQHPHISTIIQEEEKECLNYINDCTAEEFEDIKLGYEISFYFDENPYFENNVITKTMHLASSANARSESTPIHWKEGKNLMEKYSLKISNHGKRKRQFPPATFFSWFLDNSNPSADEVAETIKEDLWPSALQYYLSKKFGDENGKFEDEDDSDIQEILDSDVEEIDTSEVEDDEGLEKENPVYVAEVDSIAEAELAGNLSVDENYESDADSNEEALEEDISEETKTDQKKSDNEVTEEEKDDVENT